MKYLILDNIIIQNSLEGLLNVVKVKFVFRVLIFHKSLLIYIVQNKQKQLTHPLNNLQHFILLFQQINESLQNIIFPDKLRDDLSLNLVLLDFVEQSVNESQLPNNGLVGVLAEG